MDTHWFKQWKKYVGFDSWDKYQMGDQNVYPGSVDNSGLLRGKHEHYTDLFLYVLLYYVILYYIKQQQQQQSGILVDWSTLLHHSGSSMHPEEGRTKKSADIVFSSLSLFLSQGFIETSSACLSFFVCFVLREVVQ